MRTVKFIIVGSGNMAKTYSDIISKNPITKLLAIVGNKSGRENELAKLYDARPYSNCDLIQAINDNPDVESIIVATSEWIRKDIINIALSAGKHVLYEKPLAVSYEEASEISKLFKLSKNNSIIMPVFNLRFNSQNDAFQKVVMLEYPRKGIWTLALVTGESKNKDGKKFYHLFLPTSPNPTSGYMLYIATSDVKETDMSSEEAIKIIISGGALSPKDNEIN